MKSFSIISFITIILLLAIELLIGMALPLSRDEVIYKTLEPHEQYLWRVRSNLNMNFFGAPLETNENGFRIGGTGECKKTVGVFGASPSFGWGVPETKTYSFLLHEKFKGQGICFKNFSNIGFSSTQGKRLLKDILESNKIDYAIITYMVNDLDFIRFFYEDEKSDEQVFKEIKKYRLGPVRKVLQESHFIRLAKRFSRMGENSLPSLKTIEAYPGQRRVTLDELIQNHNDIIRLAKSKNVKLVYFRLPIGLKFFYDKHKEACEKFFKFSEGETYLSLLKQVENQGFAAFSAACPEHPVTSFRALYNYLKGEGRDKDPVQLRSHFERGSAIYAMAKLDEYDENLAKLLKNNDIFYFKLPIPKNKENLDRFFLAKQKDYVHPGIEGHDIIFKKLEAVLPEVFTF